MVIVDGYPVVLNIPHCRSASALVLLVLVASGIIVWYNAEAMLMLRTLCRNLLPNIFKRNLSVNLNLVSEENQAESTSMRVSAVNV